MVTIDLPAFVAADGSYDLGSGDATCFYTCMPLLACASSCPAPFSKCRSSGSSQYENTMSLSWLQDQ